MPRNISFALTTRQFRNRTKTVTRRLGWDNLKVGEILNGCEKCQGLRKGEKINILGQIRVVSARREPLSAITQDEVTKEGFPNYTVEQFVAFFCSTHAGCTWETEVNRIEFEYLD